jgi:hypothetical protein
MREQQSNYLEPECGTNSINSYGQEHVFGILYNRPNL